MSETTCVRCGAADEPESGIVIGLIGELNEPTCNICRADELRENTVLKRRESEVMALKEIGVTHSGIADQLDITKSTVDEYSRRISEKRRRAQQTTSILGYL